MDYDGRVVGEENIFGQQETDQFLYSEEQSSESQEERVFVVALKTAQPRDGRGAVDYSALLQEHFGFKQFRPGIRTS